MGQVKELDIIRLALNNKAKAAGTERVPVTDYGVELAKHVRDFHEKLNGYGVTPLYSLNELSRWCGISGIYVKDESKRFGLNAFKALGGVYAVARIIADRMGWDIETLEPQDLFKPEVKEKLSDLAFATATDGNHGRGVAWSANLFGFKSYVFMPHGSKQYRLEAIRQAGAIASITDMNYDDTVRMVAQKAAENGWQVVQDTAWEGYTDVPKWIMQGYTTIPSEIQEQLAEMGVDSPTHIVLQAGVGAMAGAVEAYYADLLGENRPYCIVLEPHNAACFYESVLAGDGKPHGVGGNLETMMVGLACGEPNPIAWKIIRDYGDACISVDDYLAKRGIRVLANPLPDDPVIISGDSAAAGIGLLITLAERRDLDTIRKSLKIDGNSRFLIISTEGITDPDNYWKVMWE